jgi:hypothetical protein
MSKDREGKFPKKKIQNRWSRLPASRATPSKNT